jgi:LPXTG-motif cell wall-anchored protein
MEGDRRERMKIDLAEYGLHADDKSPRGPRAWYIAAAILGLVPVMVAAIMWNSHFRAYEHGPPTTGVVQDVYDDGQGLVRFYVEGMKWLVVDDVLGHEVGETVVVAYDPEDPSRYAAVRPTLVDLSVAWWFFGVGVLILGSTAFFFVRRKRRRRLW